MAMANICIHQSHEMIKLNRTALIRKTIVETRVAQELRVRCRVYLYDVYPKRELIQFDILKRIKKNIAKCHLKNLIYMSYK